MTRLLTVLMVIAFTGCKTTSRNHSLLMGSQTQKNAQTPSFPGFDEHLLVGDENGNMVILHVGSEITTTKISGKLGSFAAAGAAIGNQFLLVDIDRKLSTIDLNRGALTQTVQLKDDFDPAGMAFDPEDESRLFITSNSDAKIRQINQITGQTTATIDLNAWRHGATDISTKQMLFTKDLLIVEMPRGEAPGAVVLIDKKTLAVTKVVEIEDLGNHPNGKVPGINPDGAMVWHKGLNKIYIPIKGIRPQSTGMIVRLDLSTKELDPWSLPADSGWQGPIILNKDETKMIIGYHTSTPQTSTHVFPATVEKNGELVFAGHETLLDAFEVLPEFPINASQSLMAFYVNCVAGFCVGGKGVSLVNLNTWEVYPRMSDNEIGLVPAFVLFR